MPERPSAGSDPVGHILLAAPEIRHFALTDALVRLLARRGLRVSVLAADAVTARFLDAHGIAVHALQPLRRGTAADPTLDEFARRDARLAGRGLDRGALRRAHARLARLAPPLVRHFETTLPDVVLFFDGRDGLARLVHATAQVYGCATAHLGAGLLPGTLQCDFVGVDGDRAPPAPASTAADRSLLDAALASALAGGVPGIGPAPRVVFPPTLGDRVATFLRAWRDGETRARRARLAAWQAATRLFPREARTMPAQLPPPPYLAVLLQDADDARLRLDADPAPDAASLIETAQRSARALGLGPRLVVVLPPHGDAGLRAIGPRADLVMLPPIAATSVAATAAAIVTVNHPRAFVGALAGTPTLCVGRAFWARDGLAAMGPLRAVEEGLRKALSARADKSSRATATQIVRDELLWCDAAQPDGNGLAGIARWLENLLARTAPPPPPALYEPGPPWPRHEGEHG